MAMATRQSLLESVLLRRKIMGPTWLALKEPKPFSKSFQVRQKPFSTFFETIYREAGAKLNSKSNLTNTYWFPIATS